jgi:hypothetical protein
MKFIFILISLLSLKIQASDFYVCDCQTGADTNCIAGIDTSTGSIDNPWQSYEKARITFATLAAGDSLQFCQGGYWNVNSSNSRWVNGNCQANNRCVVKDYVAHWATGDEINPIIERLDGRHMFALEDGGSANHEEGYEFRNLEIKGNGLTGAGFLLYNDIDDVLLDNLIIDNFFAGVNLAGSNSCIAGDIVCDAKNSRIVLSNSRVTNNLEQGWIGSSSGSRILNNYFSDNGNRAMLDHNVYLGTHSHVDDMQVIGNELYHAALDVNGVCQSAPLVVHGSFNNLLIENNLISEDVGFAGGGCWGLVVDAAYRPDQMPPGIGERFDNVIIKGNTIKNVGNVGIGLSSCIDCVVENNIIIQQASNGMRAIIAPDRPLEGLDVPMDNVIIRNNTIFVSDGTAITVNDQGTNHIIVSNTIYYTGSSSQFNCLQTTNLSHTAFDNIDNNICNHPNASIIEWVDTIGTLVSWQLQSGFDNNSSESNPGFLDSTNLIFSANATDSIMVNSGHKSLSSTTDIEAVNRDNMPDIGAFEWVSADLIYLNGFE